MDESRTRGRYVILGEIGRGAMATVYAAAQLDLDRQVALKELRVVGAGDQASAQRFLREAKLAGSFNHPNIVTVHEFFVHGAVPYIAMEHLASGSLRPYVGRLGVAQVGGILEGLLAGLAHAQRRQVVHRDIKPENILVAPDGGIKIADFGIARATGVLAATSALTATGTTVGTPSYMAPEQARAQQLGPSTDLYSVGITAFELLVGRTPFGDTGDPMGIVMRQISEPVPWVSHLAPTVDPAISDWVSWLVSKSPADRPQDATEAWRALEDVLLAVLGPRWRRDAALSTPPGRTSVALRASSVTSPSLLLPVVSPATEAAMAAMAATVPPSWAARQDDATRPATVPGTRRATRPGGPLPGRRRSIRAVLASVAALAGLVTLGVMAIGAVDGPTTAPMADAASTRTPHSTPSRSAARDVVPSPAQPRASEPTLAAASGPDSLADRVAPAQDLQQRYARSATKLYERIQSGLGRGTDLLLVTALRQTAHAYGDAAAAATGGDASAYTAAVADAARGRQMVTALLAAQSVQAPPGQSGQSGQPANTSSQPQSACAGDSTSDDPSDDDCGE